MEYSVGSNNIIAGTPYRSPALDVADQNNLILTLFISPAQIVYLISEKGTAKPLLLQPYQNRHQFTEYPTDEFFNEVQRSDDWLSNFRGDCRVKILSTDFMLVPPAFDDDMLINAWCMQFADPVNQKIPCSDAVEEAGAKLVYCLPAEMQQSLNQSGNLISMEHTLSGFIRHCLRINSGSCIYCCVHTGFLQVVLVEDKKIKFANIFHYQAAEDGIYYLMAVFHMHHLNAEEIPIEFYGELVKDSALYRYCYKYIRNIRWGSTAGAWILADDYPFPPQFYFSLFCS